tara:strand:+ start:414 stop:719 length:306 start_codon:yes stop_codon:yes gene_type:complete
MLTIKTNNVPRPLMHFGDFNETIQLKIRKEYDWMESQDIESNFGFFVYCGQVYHLQDFMRVTDVSDPDLNGWDGYASDSVWSGTLVKLTEDCDFVIVGRFF